MLSNADYMEFIEEKTRMLILKSGLERKELIKGVGFTEVTLSNFLRRESGLCLPYIVKVVTFINGSTNSYFDVSEEEEKEFLRKKNEVNSNKL